jgi:hypothetical protein
VSVDDADRLLRGDAIDVALRGDVLDALASSMKPVFAVLGLVAILGLVAALALPDRQLRSS